MKSRHQANGYINHNSFCSKPPLSYFIKVVLATKTHLCHLSTVHSDSVWGETADWREKESQREREEVTENKEDEMRGDSQ